MGLERLGAPCAYRGSGFRSQHSHGGKSCLVHSSGLSGHCVHVVHIQADKLIHIKQKRTRVEQLGGESSGREEEFPPSQKEEMAMNLIKTYYIARCGKCRQSQHL